MKLELVGYDDTVFERICRYRQPPPAFGDRPTWLNWRTLVRYHWAK